MCAKGGCGEGDVSPVIKMKEGGKVEMMGEVCLVVELNLACNSQSRPQSHPPPTTPAPPPHSPLLTHEKSATLVDRCNDMNIRFPPTSINISLSLSLTHTHTHPYTHTLSLPLSLSLFLSSPLSLSLHVHVGVWCLFFRCCKW